MNTKETSVWEFVEKYYPNYSRCNEIAENDDLQVIVDAEIEEGSCAEDYFYSIADDLGMERDEHGKIRLTNLSIRQEAKYRLNESNAIIFERAIEGYLETLKKQ